MPASWTFFFSLEDVRDSSYLSRVERVPRASLHEEHVNEVDEDARSSVGVSCCKGQPLVDDHKDQVAKETEQEEQLRQEDQVEVELSSEVSKNKTSHSVQE